MKCENCKKECETILTEVLVLGDETDYIELCKKCNKKLN